MSEIFATIGWAFLLPPLMMVASMFFWISNHPVRGLYLAFFASGILMAPNLPLVRDKLSLTEVVMLVTWLAILFHAGRRSGRRMGQRLPLRHGQRVSLLLGLLFILWTILSFLLNNYTYSDVLAASALETVNFAYGYLIFATVVLLVDDWQKWQGCLTGWLLGTVVVSGVGALAVLGYGPEWAYEDFTGRISSTLKNENQVPSFLLPIFPLMVFMAVRRSASMLFRSSMLLLTLAAFMTAVGSGSRTALLMLFLLFFGILYIAVREVRGRAFNHVLLLTAIPLLSLVMIAYVAAALAAYDGHYALGHTPAWQRPVVTLYEWLSGVRGLDENRATQAEFVIDAIFEHLYIGTGPKNYSSIYSVEEIHNTYLGLLIQTGVVGLVLFLFWVLYSIHLGWRASHLFTDPFQRVMVVSLVVGMVALLFYSMTMFGLRQRNIWLLTGLLVAAWRFVPAARPGRVMPAREVAGLSVLREGRA